MSWRELYNYWQNNYDEGAKFQPALIAYLADKGMEQEVIERVLYIAWREGHSAGYGEVLGHVSDLYWVVTGEYLN